MPSPEAASSHATLAELYMRLHEINGELQATSQVLPLTTSKFGNALPNRERTAKARQDAVLRKQRLETEQLSLRAAIGVKSKEGARKLHIDDLPEEILCEIFGHLRRVSYVEEASGLECLHYATKDIKHARLTCRRFCGASSHLLLSFLKLDITPASLSRVREISQHHVIRKGVRGVKVRMNLYSEAAAGSLDIFATYNIGQLRKEIRRLEGLREWNNIEKEIKKANVIINAWEALSADPSRPSHNRDERYLQYQVLLKEAHEEYRIRRRSQRDILESGSFVRELGVAIALMPRIRGLQLCGGSWFDNVRINFGILKNDDILRQALLLPIACQDHGLFWGDQPPVMTLAPLAHMINVSDAGSTRSTGPLSATSGLHSRELRRLTLSNLTLTRPQLEKVVRTLSGSVPQITLKDINLATNTWAGVLDLLRQYPVCQWFLDNPAGQECDFMDIEEKRTIFGNPRTRLADGLSLAECYMARRPGYSNPLRFNEEVNID
ncbi:hypothetical protein SCAR479_10730 [Seiridium cardinale]|uniref:F-box domain-containing protein n=1 Tax=Seiridium cardinale TaxID=138064 RepID=A0ABR2XFW3_9PEZI